MKRHRDLEETFEPVIASNAKMAHDIIKDNRNLEMKKETLRPKIGSKRRLVNGDYGPLDESFPRKYMDDAVDRLFGMRYENGH